MNVKRNLSLAAVAGALLMAPQFASAQTTPAPVVVAPAAPAGTMGIPAQRAANLAGTDLIGPDGNKVGEIENMLVDSAGNVRAVVVEWGGFLGMGDREALVPAERIKLGATANDRATISMTRQQLEAMPRWDRNRLADYSTENNWGTGTRWYR